MITILLLLLFSGTATAQPALALIERALALKHPVAQLKTDSLATRLSTQDSTGLLLFDVRRADEFAVSRIRGAVRADPDLSADEFARMFAGALKEKELVFYCSVGYRSSILLERVQQQALDAGVVSLANLRGGIFRWYNERRPLHDGTGKVDTVHGYDAFWSRLLKKRCLSLICLEKAPQFFHHHLLRLFDDIAAAIVGRDALDDPALGLGRQHDDDRLLMPVQTSQCDPRFDAVLDKTYQPTLVVSSQLASGCCTITAKKILSANRVRLSESMRCSFIEEIESIGSGSMLFPLRPSPFSRLRVEVATS